VLTVANAVGVSRPAVWRWQQRFAEAGVDGLLRDKTRKPGKPPLPPFNERRENSRPARALLQQFSDNARVRTAEYAPHLPRGFSQRIECQQNGGCHEQRENGH